MWYLLFPSITDWKNSFFVKGRFSLSCNVLFSSSLRLDFAEALWFFQYRCPSSEKVLEPRGYADQRRWFYCPSVQFDVDNNLELIAHNPLPVHNRAIQKMISLVFLILYWLSDEEMVCGGNLCLTDFVRDIMIQTLLFCV